MAKKKLKTILKRAKKAFMIRLDESDRATIKARASQYADGNMSEFMRYAALNFKPTDKDLV